MYEQINALVSQKTQPRLNLINLRNQLAEAYCLPIVRLFKENIKSKFKFNPTTIYIEDFNIVIHRFHSQNFP